MITVYMLDVEMVISHIVQERHVIRDICLGIVIKLFSSVR